MEVQMVTSGLGKKSQGVQLALADAAKPQCLVPFSLYVSDPASKEVTLGCKVTDLVGKKINVMALEMSPANFGSGINISGDFALATNSDKNIK